MSLINKMLQDLDARRSEVTGIDALGMQIRPVPAPPRKHVALWVALALGAGLVAVVAWEIWRTSPLAGRDGISRQVVQNRIPAPASASSKIVAAPASAPVASIAPAPNAHVPASAGMVPNDADRNASAAVAGTASLMLSRSLADSRSTEPVAAKAEKPAVETARGAINAAVKMTKTDTETVHARKQAAEKAVPAVAPEPVAKEAPPVVAPVARQFAQTATPALNKQIKELTLQQRSDNEYRKAITLSQQGMRTEAMNNLDQALQLDPRNVAARQMLIGLLLENNRQEDALRIARIGLGLDATQPALAMIAARLQTEKGDLRTAIETLENTLPHATDRADYQSFLAALLQRDGRHKEAVEHYLVALQKAPQNGVWWMGLGISFQADNRQAEAKESFTRAKASNSLSPELLAFVESRLRQLRP